MKQTQQKEAPKRRNGYYLYENKRYLPSVSTIMGSVGSSGGLINWSAKEGGKGVIHGLLQCAGADGLADRLSTPACLKWAEEAAIRGLQAEQTRVQGFGSRVHLAIENYLNGSALDLVNFDEAERVAYETFVKFYEDVGFAPTSVEGIVYNEDIGYAGQVDLVATFTKHQVGKLRTYLTDYSADIQPGVIVVDFKTGTLYPKKHGVQLAAYRDAYTKTTTNRCDAGLVIGIHRDRPDKIECIYYSGTYLDEIAEKVVPQARAIWEYYDAPKWFKETGGLIE